VTLGDVDCALEVLRALDRTHITMDVLGVRLPTTHPHQAII